MVLQVRISDEDVEILERRSRELGMDRSSYVRLLIRGSEVVVRTSSIRPEGSVDTSSIRGGSKGVQELMEEGKLQRGVAGLEAGASLRLGRVSVVEPSKGSKEIVQAYSKERQLKWKKIKKDLF